MHIKKFGLMLSASGLLVLSFAADAMQRERISDLIPSCALENGGDGYDCVSNSLNAYLDSEQVALKKTKGYTFYVGFASAKFPPESKNYEQSVLLAHDQAYYEAVSTALRETNSHVTTEVFASLEENQDAEAIKAACEPNASERIVEKALKFTEAKLDEALTKLGRESAPGPSVGEPFKCENPAFLDSFSRKTVLKSMDFLRGVAVVHSIVAGQHVGVVVATGGKLSSAAGILARQERPSSLLVSAEQEIRGKLDLDSEETDKLRTLFGTRLFFLSNGEPAIVSFGMAQANTTATKSVSLQASKRRAAKQRADSFARAQLSVFSGTSAQLESITKDSQSEEEFFQYTEGSNYYDMGNEASITSYLSQNVRATSQLKMQGVRELFGWNHKAENGAIIEGTVLAWSPSMMVVSQNPELIGKEQADLLEEGEIQPEVRESTQVKEDW